MDLKQKKLSKSEWNSIEISVSEILDFSSINPKLTYLEYETKSQE